MDFEDTWLFARFEDAMSIHKQLFTMLREQGFVTYAELLCMVGDLNNIVYPKIYNNYGWTNLFGVKVELFGSYWGIKMPELEILKKESN